MTILDVSWCLDVLGVTSQVYRMRRVSAQQVDREMLACLFEILFKAPWSHWFGLREICKPPNLFIFHAGRASRAWEFEGVEVVVLVPAMADGKTHSTPPEFPLDSSDQLYNPTAKTLMRFPSCDRLQKWLFGNFFNPGYKHHWGFPVNFPHQFLTKICHHLLSLSHLSLRIAITITVHLHHKSTLGVHRS